MVVQMVSDHQREKRRAIVKRGEPRVVCTSVYSITIDRLGIVVFQWSYLIADVIQDIWKVESLSLSIPSPLHLKRMLLIFTPWQILHKINCFSSGG